MPVHSSGCNPCWGQVEVLIVGRGDYNICTFCTGPTFTQSAADEYLIQWGTTYDTTVSHYSLTRPLSFNLSPSGGFLCCFFGPWETVFPYRRVAGFYFTLLHFIITLLIHLSRNPTLTQSAANEYLIQWAPPTTTTTSHCSHTRPLSFNLSPSGGFLCCFPPDILYLLSSSVCHGDVDRKTTFTTCLCSTGRGGFSKLLTF